MRYRVLMLAAAIAAYQVTALCQSSLNLTPSRVVGQPAIDFRSSSPNVVEGREFFLPWNVVVDRSMNPPALYVSDFGNNRVLGWRNALTFTNGSQADIVIGQLDFASTYEQGPGTARVTGLTRPGGLAVDRDGNLYVVDSGNNRILRFPKPFDAASADVRIPNMVIGQPNFSTESANTGGLSEKTVAISSGSTLGRTGLAFDAQGNLWFSDALNNRVLRYPAAALAEGRNQPAADIVLGQTAFNIAATVDTSNTARLNKAQLRNPSGIAVDSANRLYVADALGRVLVYTGTFFNGKEAARILGMSARPPAQQTLNEYALGSAEGLTLIGDRLAVADPGLNRVLIYDPFPEWPAETEQLPSPPAKQVIGQGGFRDATANRGLAEPSEVTLSGPVGVHYSGTELFVADTNNHRVLVFPQQATGAGATRVLGQIAFNFNAPNMVVGRELFVFNGFGDATGQSFSDGAGIAIDTYSATPRLYIADTFNNRVLGYADARRVKQGDAADIVIGQNDMNRVLINAPFNDRDSLSDTGLFRPSGVVVDKNGDLFVADSGNGRVLRFPAPFDQTVGQNERRKANLVLGQINFNQRIIDATSRNMAYPFGLAFTGAGDLLVSDVAHSRILFFKRPAGGDFTSGQAAERVIGQPDFFTVGRGNASNRMNGPRHLAVDTDDRLYAVDTGNNRLLMYDRITVVGNDPTPSYIQAGLNSPQGVYVSSLTGEIWVAGTKGNRALRFPRYERLVIEGKSDYEIPSNTPLALTQDAAGNLYILEGVNRVAIFFSSMRFTSNASYSVRPLSPGMAAILWAEGSNARFADQTYSATSFPLPTQLGDVQVMLNDKPVPLYAVTPNQINFYVPMSAPNAGTAEVQVVRQSTGQIISMTRIPFDRVSPSLFTLDQTGQGQVAALNPDNSVNSPSNPISRGQYISLYGTGQGFIADAPPDGEPATGPVPSQEVPLRVILGTDFVKDEDIQYSGLAPGLVGVWQINVRIPDTVAASNAVPVAVQLRSISSTIPDPSSSRRLNTTIAVRP